jgi:DNA gyrase inhibitor GyrI
MMRLLIVIPILAFVLCLTAHSAPLVRIVNLPAMRVAYTHAISKSPEHDATTALHKWARLRKLFDDRAKHFFFGYNNPPPSVGMELYGYEYMVTVDSTVTPDGGVSIKQIPGGLYAVVRCKGAKNIPETWEYLIAWSQDNEEYEFDIENEPGLEEVLNPLEPDVDDLIFDCYLPIKPTGQ